MWPASLRDPVELVDEVHVPGGAAELTVRRRAQAHLLLLAHDLFDRLVLDLTELRRVDPAGGMVVARLQQSGRAEQAADVVGAKRGLRAFADDRSPRSRRWSEVEEAGCGVALEADVEAIAVAGARCNHCLVLGVSVEVEPGDRAASGARGRTPSARTGRASAGTRNEKRPSPSVGQRPKPCSELQSSSMPSPIGAFSPSRSRPSIRMLPLGNSFCGSAQSPMRKNGPAVCEGVLIPRTASIAG